jgi:hypothetical protein
MTKVVTGTRKPGNKAFEVDQRIGVELTGSHRKGWLEARVGIEPA